jgi:GABA(A) receptor-associated protein
MNKDIPEFKKKHNFENRLQQGQNIMNKFPSRIPVIVEIHPSSKRNIPSLDKSKYLVPKELSVGQFIYILRKRMKLNAERAIFIFFNNELPPTSELMSVIYDRFKDKDMFLYSYISSENTFG